MHRAATFEFDVGALIRDLVERIEECVDVIDRSAVDGEDAVAIFDADLACERALEGFDAGAVEGVDPVGIEEKDQCHKGEEEVHDRASGNDRHADPDRLGGKFPGFADRFLVADIGHPSDFHIAAEGDPGNAVFSFAISEADHLWRVAQRKPFDLDTGPFGNQEMT